MLMKYFLFLLLLFIAACTYNSELKDDDKKSTQALVGVWRGEGDYQDQEDEDWSESWKISRHANGTFEVNYLLINDKNKEYEITTDKGKWSYVDGRYLETNSQDDKSVYKVYSVKKDWFEYNYIQRGDGVTIQETKTVDNYQLQDPPEGYAKYVYQETDSPNAEQGKSITSEKKLIENRPPEIQSKENQHIENATSLEE